MWNKEPHISGLSEKSLSKTDQENLEKKIKIWRQDKPQDSFYFKPCTLSSSPINAESNNDKTDETCVQDDLLFAHQTAWQKNIMIHYRN